MGFHQGARALSPTANRDSKPSGDDKPPIPFAREIQESFGHHDLSGMRASIGGSAASHVERLGAVAVTEGQQIHFASPPDLHTAAHEAAHAVQQSLGRREQGAMGRPSDRFERQADEVANRVANQEDAEPLLDSMAASPVPVPAVQRKEKKTISGPAARRVRQAQEAIEYTKSVIAYGAGNQYDALKKTNFNTYFRLLVMRGSEYWEIDPWVKPLAAAYPEALTAAKAEIAKGGNCGEHAQVALDYLRVKALGDPLHLSDVKGLDHAFVLMGNLSADPDNGLVVADPWPTAATACLWEDHFAYTPERKQINVRRTVVADGSNVKAVIARGIRLKPTGMALIEKTLTPEQTEKELEKGSDASSGHPWIWRHPGTTAPDRDFDYTTNGGSR